MGWSGRCMAVKYAAVDWHHNRAAWSGIRDPIPDEFKSERSNPSGRPVEG